MAGTTSLVEKTVGTTGAVETVVPPPSPNEVPKGAGWAGIGSMRGSPTVIVGMGRSVGAGILFRLGLDSRNRPLLLLRFLHPLCQGFDQHFDIGDWHNDCGP